MLVDRCRLSVGVLIVVVDDGVVCRDRMDSSALEYRLTNYIEMVRRNVYYGRLSECLIWLE